MATIRGVNLGGWFVLEQWMKPTLFDGLSGPDETIFSTEKKDAKLVLEQHWQTFITKKDIKYLKSIGINSVRLPIPWWLLGEKPYFSALPYIDQLMSWCDDLKMPVLLDLHTAPGCQNGFDNGGITGKIDWPQPANIQLTVEKLQWITNRYKKHQSFWGIEVLNEPHVTIAMEVLQDFYRRAYAVIRKESSTCAIVFHDGFRPEDPTWPVFFQSYKDPNIYFDLHLYLCFSGPKSQQPLDQMVQWAWKDHLTLIEKVSTFAKVIVGEWSLGLVNEQFKGLDAFQHENVLRLIGAAQLQAYEKAFGWYFWSYRIARSSHLGWDFERLTKRGIMSFDMTTPIE